MRKPTLIALLLCALAGTAAADPFVVNEPLQSQREITIFLVDNTGNGVSGLSTGGGVAVQIAKSGGNWVSSSATLTEIAGGPAGSYRLDFPAGEFDTLGDLAYAVTKAGTIRPYVDHLKIGPRQGSLNYDLAQGGASGSITLSVAASSTDNYYAGGGKSCLVMIVSGPGAGQARLGTGYTGFTRTLTVSPNWVTAPTSASVYDVLPYTGQLDAAQVTAIQSGLATASAVAAIPTNPELASDAKLNHLDADISSRASSSAVAAIPTNPLLTTDVRLNDLDATISSRASGTAVAAIPTNPLLTSDARLNDLDATVSSRASQTSLNAVSSSVAAIPTTPLLSTDVRLNDLDAAISTRATDAHVLAIPTNPELASDPKLAHLDADVSSRSSASAVAAIPTTPLLTSDARLNHLDADISSRLAPTVSGRTLGVTSTGQAGIDWANIANPSATQNLAATLIQGGGGGGGSGGGGDPTAIAAAVWSYVPDTSAPSGAHTFAEQWNVLWSVEAGNGVGLDGTVGSTSSADGTKHRTEFTVQAGVRTFTKRDGD